VKGSSQEYVKAAVSVPPKPPGLVTTTSACPTAWAGTTAVIARSGMATVTLRWPNADFSLQLYVTTGVCADITSLLTGGCTILGSTRQGSLPGVVTSPVTGGDLNTIWVLNPDPFPQRFTVDVHIEQSRWGGQPAGRVVVPLLVRFPSGRPRCVRVEDWSQLP
jgi:hypothetical protein